MDKINILFGYGNIFGGVLSMAVHLARSLEVMGYESAIYRLGSGAFSAEQKGFPIIGVTEEELVQLAVPGRSVLMHIHDNTSDNRHYDLNTKLLSTGVPLFIHDWRGINSRTKQAYCFAGREPLSQLFNGPCVPFPYMRSCEYVKPLKERSKLAVFATRLAKEKNIDMVLDANVMLGTLGMPTIDLYGKYESRYINFTLNMQRPEWRRYWIGQHTEQQPVLETLMQYTYAIDLSVLESTGSSPQYAFLEAMEAGCVLVINRRWLQGEGMMQEWVNCLAVSTPIELVEIVTGAHNGVSLRYEPVFEALAPRHVVPQWMEVIRNAKG